MPGRQETSTAGNAAHCSAAWAKASSSTVPPPSSAGVPEGEAKIVIASITTSLASSGEGLLPAGSNSMPTTAKSASNCCKDVRSTTE